MNCPLLISNLCTPKLMWYQTDVAVIIRILLSDVADYYLRVRNDHLLFSTIVNNDRYYLCLYLFGPVVAEKTVHKNLGREIKISLIKELKWFHWLRLTFVKEKSPLIIFDTDHVYEVDYNRKIFKGYESITEYKRKNRIQYLMPVVPSSDEEDSEDEQIDLLRYA